MNAAQAGLYVDQLTVTWRNGHTALRDASFSVPRSSIAALVGVNGSGKSTLFKALMGFVRVGHGEIAILGQPVNRALRETPVAYVRSRKRWTGPSGAGGGCGDDGPLRPYGLAAAGKAARSRDCRCRAGPRGHERVPPSADWRALRRAEKRVFLARAIAQQGQVILLDEPFTGVDVQTEARIISLLRELRDEGCTMLVSTHNLGSVSEFCDYTVMVKGTVLASGPTETTFTAENLERAFSGVLRHVALTGGEAQVITDDERPFISRRAAGGPR